MCTRPKATKQSILIYKWGVSDQKGLRKITPKRTKQFTQKLDTSYQKISNQFTKMPNITSKVIKKFTRMAHIRAKGIKQLKKVHMTSNVTKQFTRMAHIRAKGTKQFKKTHIHWTKQVTNHHAQMSYIKHKNTKQDTNGLWMTNHVKTSTPIIVKLTKQVV